MTQQYACTKIVTAWPQLGSPDNPKTAGVDGYAVKYEDGYTSWSPKAAFEAGYVAAGHLDNYPPHQQRVLAEQAVLADRIGKLRIFSGTDTFRGLPPEDQGLLLEQFDAMNAYADVLQRRVDRF